MPWLKALSNVIGFCIIGMICRSMFGMKGSLNLIRAAGKMCCVLIKLLKLYLPISFWKFLGLYLMWMMILSALMIFSLVSYFLVSWSPMDTQSLSIFMSTTQWAAVRM